MIISKLLGDTAPLPRLLWQALIMGYKIIKIYTSHYLMYCIYYSKYIVCIIRPICMITGKNKDTIILNILFQVCQTVLQSI